MPTRPMAARPSWRSSRRRRHLHASPSTTAATSTWSAQQSFPTGVTEPHQPTSATSRTPTASPLENTAGAVADIIFTAGVGYDWRDLKRGARTMARRSAPIPHDADQLYRIHWQQPRLERAGPARLAGRRRQRTSTPASRRAPASRRSSSGSASASATRSPTPA